MIKSRRKYSNKWWVKPIRFMNYLAFRYWWFVWSFFIIFLLLLFFFCCYKSKRSTTKIENCPGRDLYFKNMKEIDSLMKNCCSCAPDTSRIIEKEEILEDTIKQDEEPNVDPPPPPPPPPNSIPCNSNISANGDNQEHHKTWDLGTTSGIIRYCYDTENIPDKITLIYDGRVIHDSGIIGTSGERCFTFNYVYNPRKPRHLDVHVFPSSDSGTKWDYRIDCPR
jgi:hypothetical protein